MRLVLSLSIIVVARASKQMFSRTPHAQLWRTPKNCGAVQLYPLSLVVCSLSDSKLEVALFVKHKEGAGQQKQQLAQLAAAKAASGGALQQQQQQQRGYSRMFCRHVCAHAGSCQFLNA
jgi:hypothetical protein